MESLLPFEVSETEAREWLRAELQGVFEEAKRRVSETLPSTEDGQKPTSSSSKNVRPDQADLSLLTALSGVDPDALRSDPEALKRGLKRIGADLGSVIKGALSPSEEDRETAKARLDEMKALLDKHPKTGKRPRSKRPPARTESGAEKADALRSFADLAGTFAQAAERAGERLRAAADELRERAEKARREQEARDEEE